MHGLTLAFLALFVLRATGAAVERIRLLRKATWSITALRLVSVGTENWAPSRTENNSGVTGDALLALVKREFDEHKPA